MSESQKDNAKVERTRRNALAIAMIAGAGILARTKRAAAEPMCERGPTCFFKGTKIRTALGERKVEELVIGDLIPTIFGGVRPIQWIERYRYQKSDPHKPWVKDILPVVSPVRRLRPMCQTAICS